MVVGFGTITITVSVKAPEMVDVVVKEFVHVLVTDPVCLGTSTTTVFVTPVIVVVEV